MPKPYRLYYCLYYYLIGFWTIKFPQKVKPSLDKIFCKYRFDSTFKGFSHHNFLFADYLNYIPENKWFFTQRKFAFRTINSHQWYLLPSLTVFNVNNNKIKYGLNSSFIRKWSKDNLEFCTWNPHIQLSCDSLNLNPNAFHKSI